MQNTERGGPIVTYSEFMAASPQATETIASVPAIAQQTAGGLYTGAGMPLFDSPPLTILGALLPRPFWLRLVHPDMRMDTASLADRVLVLPPLPYTVCFSEAVLAEVVGALDRGASCTLFAEHPDALGIASQTIMAFVGGAHA